MLSILRGKSDLGEKWVYLLLFLFPMAANTVRHWISSIFLLLAITSLFYVFRKSNGPLEKREKIMIWIFVLFFLTFIVTALVNGWTRDNTSHLGVEIRFLLAIPLLLMLRRFPDTGIWLLRGVLVGAIVIFVHSVTDVYVLKYAHAIGEYSPNLTGPVAALYCVLLLVFRRIETNRMLVIAIPYVSVLAVIAVVLSGSRGGYFGFLVMSLIWVFYYSRRKQVILNVILLMIALTSVYSFSDVVRNRVNTAHTEFMLYLSTDDTLTLSAHQLGSVGDRLELWRSARQIYINNPVWGVGRGGFAKEVKQLIDQGKAHPAINNFAGHPHNAFLEMLVSKGIFGFIFICALLFYPLFIFIKTRNYSRNTAALGILHIAGFSVFSMTDASTFIKGNFSSIFIVFLVAIFAWHLRAMRTENN